MADWNMVSREMSFMFYEAKENIDNFLQDLGLEYVRAEMLITHITQFG